MDTGFSGWNVSDWEVRGSFDWYGEMWGFNDLREQFDPMDWIIEPEQAAEIQFIAASDPMEQAREIVSDGVKFLSVAFDALSKFLKVVPAVPHPEVRRFEILSDTLDNMSKGIKSGNISRDTAKESIEEALKFTFGEASDYVLSLSAGFFVNNVTNYLPGYGKFLPVLAVVGTYIAANAAEGLTDAMAEVTTEALFFVIDGMGALNNWLGVSIPSILEPIITGDVLFVEDINNSGLGDWMPTAWVSQGGDVNGLYDAYYSAGYGGDGGGGGGGGGGGRFDFYNEPQVIA